MNGVLEWWFRVCFVLCGDKGLMYDWLVGWFAVEEEELGVYCLVY